MSVPVYFMCFMLFILGLYAVMVKKNLIKIAIGLALIEYSINLLLIVFGYRWGGHAPVAKSGWFFVDPLVQELVVVAILIGLSKLVFLTSIAMKLYEKYGTLDITQIRRLRG